VKNDWCEQKEPNVVMSNDYCRGREKAFEKRFICDTSIVIRSISTAGSSHEDGIMMNATIPFLL
jgi:hypothetical protein